MILSLAWPFISLLLSAVRRLGLLRLPAPSASAVLRQGPPCAVGTARPSDLEQKLADVLKGQIERGTQLGGAICVYHKGRQVAHVVGGVYRTCDSFSAFKPVNSTTLFFVNSVSKGISAAAFMTFLDERGKKKIYDSLVAEYWPEFGSNGKQNVTVEQLLSHRAGLAQVGLLPSDILQLVKHLYLYPSNHLPLFTAMTSKLESAAPEHEPGTSAAYHALSNSFIMGGLIDRLTASKSPASINDFIHSRLCDRLKLPHSSVHLGRIPDYVIPNLAATEPPPIPKCACTPLMHLPRSRKTPTSGLWSLPRAGSSRCSTSRVPTSPRSSAKFSPLFPPSPSRTPRSGDPEEGGPGPHRPQPRR